MARRVQVLLCPLGPADTATEYNEVGCEYELHILKISCTRAAQSYPAQPVSIAHTLGSESFGNVAVHLQMPELGIGDQVAVNEQGGSNTRSKCQH